MLHRRFMTALVLAATGLWLAASGCGPGASRSDEQDDRSPYVQKARRMSQARDYKEAVKYYNQAIEMDPKNATAHLELGLLYEDKLQDYVYAIYHYRHYMELRPQAEKGELVKQFVERSRIALAASVANNTLDSGEEIARLHSDNSNLVHTVDFLTLRNQELEQKLAKFSAAPDEQKVVQVVTQIVYVATGQTGRTPPPPPPAATTSTVRPTAPTTTTAPPDSARPRTYVVQKGDTLSTISQKVYGRRDKWQAIYDANRAVIGPAPKFLLKVGQTLTIPKI